MNKIQVLHFWCVEKEVEQVVSELAATGIEFEAKLVKTESEFISALARRKFDLIIADRGAGPAVSDPSGLSASEIAMQLAPDVPFVSIGEPVQDKTGPFFYLSRQELNGLGPIMKMASLRQSGA